jgi:hypothetical protein
MERPGTSRDKDNYRANIARLAPMVVLFSLKYQRNSDLNTYASARFSLKVSAQTLDHTPITSFISDVSKLVKYLLVFRQLSLIKLGSAARR